MSVETGTWIEETALPSIIIFPIMHCRNIGTHDGPFHLIQTWKKLVLISFDPINGENSGLSLYYKVGNIS